MLDADVLHFTTIVPRSTVIH